MTGLLNVVGVLAVHCHAPEAKMSHVHCCTTDEGHVAPMCKSIQALANQNKGQCRACCCSVQGCGHSTTNSHKHWVH